MELVVVLLVTLGVIGLAGRLPEGRLVKRALARARRQSPAALADGKVVTVHGTVVPVGEVLASPVSGQRCVFYRVTFDELGTGGDYRELGRVEAQVPFELEVDGRRIPIAANTPQLGIHGDVHVRAARDLVDPHKADPLIMLAKAVCKRTPNYPTSSGLRITEHVLAPGRQVTIQGVCTFEPDPTREADDGVYRDGSRPTRPVISGTRRSRLMIG